MSTEVVSWNVAGNLQRHPQSIQVVNKIAELDADIVILSESSAPRNTIVDCVELESLGYAEQYVQPYNSTPDDLTNHHYLMLLSKQSVDVQPIHLGGIRNGLHVSTESNGKEINIFGVHLHDRTEKLRRKMINNILREYDSTLPTAVIGDLNAMHGNSKKASLLRDIGRAKLPFLKNPQMPLVDILPFERVRDLGTRLCGMAEGTVMLQLEQAGFQDADKNGSPTMIFGGIPWVQLDHIMHNEHMKVKDFQLHRGASDHKAISATLSSAI